MTKGKDKNHVIVRGNVMSYRGAVERWTLRLRVSQTVSLEAVEVLELRREGTFSYPLVQ